MSKPFKFRDAWWIRFTDEFGKRRERVFDDFAAAAHALTAEKARVREVKIGLRSPTPPIKTFNELADYWLANRASQKWSGHHDVSIIRAHLRPAFGPLKLKDIGVAEADRFTCDRMHLDKKTVANLLTLLYVPILDPSCQRALFSERNEAGCEHGPQPATMRLAKPASDPMAPQW